MSPSGICDSTAVRPRLRFALGLCVAVLFVGVAIYARALPFPFCRDDELHLLMPERWERPPARLLEHFREDFWRGVPATGLYRPLTAVTIQATAWWRGLDPLPLRAGNLLLHALVALTAAALARRGGVTRAGASLLALLLVAHPLFSEDVLEVVSRSELQAALGTLAAAWFLIGARIGPGAAVGGALCYLFALLSKEGAIAAMPALMVLPIRRCAEPLEPSTDRRARFAASLLLLAPLLAVLLLRAAVLGNVVGLDASTVVPLDNALVGEPFPVRLVTGVANLGRYVGLVAAPVSLSPDYSFAAITPLHGIADARFAVGALALLLGGAWLVAAWRRGRRIETFGLTLAGASWFLVSSIAAPIGTIFAERLFCMPACGLLIAGVAAVDRIVAARAGAATQRGVVLAGALAAAGLGVRTHVRTGDWQDDFTLYSRALAVVPESARVHCSVGHSLRLASHEAEAQAELGRALDLLPTYRQAMSEVGMVTLVRARALKEAPALAQSYVWFWLADHAPGAGPIDKSNFEQVAEVVRRTGLRRAEIVRAAEAIADARRDVPLYVHMRKELAPDGR